jgi:hypothetical protein
MNHDCLSILKNPLIDLNAFMDVEIHSVRHFFWLRGASNEQIMSQIKETYGDGVIHLRSVQRWTHDFAAERTELDALPRLGRAIHLENVDRVSEFLEGEPIFPRKHCQED